MYLLTLITILPFFSNSTQQSSGKPYILFLMYSLTSPCGSNAANIICGVLYCQHNSPELFLKYFEEIKENLIATGKPVYVMTDANINLLSFDSCNYAQDFLLTLQSLNLTPCIDKPTRVHRNSFSLIDNIFINKGLIIIKTLFLSLGLKFGTVFPKAIEVCRSTYSKFKHYYLQL